MIWSFPPVGLCMVACVAFIQLLQFTALLFILKKFCYDTVFPIYLSITHDMLDYVLVLIINQMVVDLSLLNMKGTQVIPCICSLLFYITKL